MSQAGILNGRLEEFSLVELLQAMGLSTNTGALHLHQADGRTGVIYFENGAIVSCTEIDTEALTLGGVLQQLKLATIEQLEQAFQQQTQDPLGKRIGERLIDLDILTQEQLNDALRTQALWTVRELGLWHHGSYEFHPGERLPSDASVLRIDYQRATMELVRYEHEWQGLSAFLPEGMRTHIQMAFEPPAGHPLLFHATAWRVITRVNSQRTVRRMATSLQLPELDVARMVGPLVREGLLVPVGAAGGPGLPEEAARLSMQHFDLFTLLISMEQDWLKRKSPADQLIALAGFINQTMSTLEEACLATGLSLAPDTLLSLLDREHLLGIGPSYELKVRQNRVDLEDFSGFCHRTFEGTARNALGATKDFYDVTAAVLQRGLAAAFEAINARIASPVERVQNQEAWEALFITFRGDSPVASA
ncbi:MAG TPA: DUF4388 domain-containing protein [Ktedonobacterales bacterium]|nr:DUF4388 domain-containing protein [Ktedonobacterales bacterium]